MSQKFEAGSNWEGNNGRRGMSTCLFYTLVRVPLYSLYVLHLCFSNCVVFIQVATHAFPICCQVAAHAMARVIACPVQHHLDGCPLRGNPCFLSAPQRRRAYSIFLLLPIENSTQMQSDGINYTCAMMHWSHLSLMGGDVATSVGDSLATSFGR